MKCLLLGEHGEEAGGGVSLPAWSHMGETEAPADLGMQWQGEQMEKVSPRGQAEAAMQSPYRQPLARLCRAEGPSDSVRQGNTLPPTSPTVCC